MYRRNGPPSRKEIETPRLELNVWREPREDGWEHTRVELLDNHAHHMHGINCGCFPKTSNSFIPSMIYDDVRCPHYENENLIQPGQQHMLTYPWTVQTFAPPRDLYGRKASFSPDKMSIGSFYRSPSIVSAPPRVLHRPTESASLKKPRPLPPYSAPNHRDKKFKAPASADSYRNEKIFEGAPSITTVDQDDYSIKYPEINDPDKPMVTQFDSVSQVATIGRHDFGVFRQPTNKKRGPRIDRQFLLTPPKAAVSTPQPRPNSITDSFKNSPRRIFSGQYLDPRSGKKYEYDIKYRRQRVMGKRNVVAAI